MALLQSMLAYANDLVDDILTTKAQWEVQGSLNGDNLDPKVEFYKKDIDSDDENE